MSVCIDHVHAIMLSLASANTRNIKLTAARTRDVTPQQIGSDGFSTGNMLLQPLPDELVAAVAMIIGQAVDALRLLIDLHADMHKLVTNCDDLF